MKILLVSHRYPPEHFAGTEVYTANLARGLVERGHGVEVFTAEKEISRGHLTLHQREHDGVRVHELVNNLHYEEFRESWDHPPIDLVFGELLDELAPDLVHFHHLLYLSAGCVEEAVAHEIPIVFTLHDYWLQCPRFGQRIRGDGELCHQIDFETCGACLADFRYANSRGEQRMAEWLAGLRSLTGLNLASLARHVGDRLRAKEPRGEAAPVDPAVAAALRAEVEVRDAELRERLTQSVDLFLSPSRFLREAFLEWGLPPERIEHLRSGVDLGVFGVRGRTPRGETLRVGFVGSLVRVKGPHVLLEAWRELDPASRAHATLEVFGPPGHDLDYQEQLATLAREGGATLRGPLRRDEVPRILRELDLLVVPSVWFENQPLVILEALAAGTPLAVSDLGGMAELVEPGRSGWRFPVGDVAALTNLLRERIEAPAALDALYAEPVQLPTVDDQLDGIERVYRELAAEASRK